jgi:hypothetical protein
MFSRKHSWDSFLLNNTAIIFKFIDKILCLYLYFQSANMNFTDGLTEKNTSSEKLLSMSSSVIKLLMEKALENFFTCFSSLVIPPIIECIACIYQNSKLIYDYSNVVIPTVTTMFCCIYINRKVG